MNNISKKLGDDLKNEIKAESTLSIAAACFSIYAFEELRTELESIKELKFIFTFLFHNREDWKRKQRVLYPRQNRERRPHKNGI